MDETKICTGCGYVITSKYLSLNGEDWHSTCVFCDECEGPVFTGEGTTKYHTQDGKIYCPDCVTNLFQVCADCGQPAKKYVKALGKIWHTFHFKCASCKSILDSYAEVDGEAYCQPCHQRMSAKNFTKAKRRSFGTEKRESAAKAAARPPWAQKPRTSTNAPKSALDVMHKSWFQNGLNKKPPSPAPSSPSPSPTPPSSNGSSHSPRSGASSPTNFNRPYSPTPPTPLSPTIPKSYSPSSAPTAAKPAGGSRIPPLSSASSLQSRGSNWSASKPAAEDKSKWPPTTNKQVTSPTPVPFSRSNLKPTPGSTLYGSPATSSPSANAYASANSRAGATSPNGTYTNISFVPKDPAPPKTRNQVVARDPSIPPGAVNIADILEAIFRPLTEEEIGSLAYQALPILAEIHNQGKLHDNIKHKTIYISPNGVVTIIATDGEDESKVGGSSIKFKAPENNVSVQSDIYSLGVALWTSADYLLDEEEEPALSADFCEFIGGMTDDEPENRPSIRTLIKYVEKYRDLSTQYLAALIKEVDRKKLLRKEISEDKERKQKEFGKLLLQEVVKGVMLRHVDTAALTPAAKQTNPHEVMCMRIRSFNLNQLRRIDPAKLPIKQYKLNPRERLMQAVKEGINLRKACVVGGHDLNALIVQVPNHPTYGVFFRDVSALFTVPKVSSAIMQQICTRYTGDPPDLFVATPTDAGIFFASLVAEFFNRGVIVLQNAGRLPRKMEKYSCGYETLGYVNHALELQLQKNLVKENTTVVLIDEMLVNGAILEAARVILRETGAKIKEVICIAELEGFGGRQKIKSFECNVHALYVFNDNQEQHR